MRSYLASSILAAAFVLTPVVAGYAPASSKAPFTITNDPVHDTVVDTMLAQTCTGTLVPIWWSMRPTVPVQAIFYGKPGGTKWVKFYGNGIGPEDYPVTELGRSAQWQGLTIFLVKGTRTVSHYAVWPDGDNHISGTTVDPYGTMQLPCRFEPAWWGK
jgi:hypothetical protein